MRANDGTIPSPLSTDSLPETTVMLADAALTVLGAELPVHRESTTLALLNELGD